MGDHADRDPLEDRILRTKERLRVANERMIEAKEEFALAQEHL
jgi:hypothetical protein